MATREVAVGVVAKIVNQALYGNYELRLHAEVALTSLVGSQYEAASEEYKSANILTRLFKTNPSRPLDSKYPANFNDWSVSQVKRWWGQWNVGRFWYFSYPKALPLHPYAVLQEYEQRLLSISAIANDHRGSDLIRLDDEEWAVLRRVEAALIEWQESFGEGDN